MQSKLSHRLWTLTMAVLAVTLSLPVAMAQDVKSFEQRDAPWSRDEFSDVV